MLLKGEVDNTPVPESSDATAQKTSITLARARRRRGGRESTVNPSRASSGPTTATTNAPRAPSARFRQGSPFGGFGAVN